MLLHIFFQKYSAFVAERGILADSTVKLLPQDKLAFVIQAEK